MIFGIEINTWFTLGFLALGIPLIALELYGVYRRVPDPETGKRKWGGDTISENWWWLRERAPWLRVPMAGFLIWLFYHFIFEGRV